MKNTLHIFLACFLFGSCDQIKSYQDDKEKAAKYDSIMNSASSNGDIISDEQPSLATTIYNDCIGSVVTIETDNGGIGSGFFVKPNIIATNYHVIRGSRSVGFKLSNAHDAYSITGYVAVDTHNDLILLECEGIRGVPLNISNSLPQIGENIFVIGSPLGLEASLSDGTVSGLRNTGEIKLIQVTAPISPGNSGGPVLNNKKQVVGISEMYLRYGQNLNFAIPSQNLLTLMSYIETYSSPLSDLSRIDDNYFAQEQSNYQGNPYEVNNSTDEISQVEFHGQYMYKASAFGYAAMYDVTSTLGQYSYQIPEKHVVYVIREAENNMFYIFCDGHWGYISKGMLKGF